MSKFIILIFVTFLTVLVVGLPNPAPAGKPGYCHDFGVEIKEGERAPAPVGHCAQLTCLNATKNNVAALQCGLIAAPQKGCELLLEDLTKEYPDCCARTVCKDGN